MYMCGYRLTIPLMIEEKLEFYFCQAVKYNYERALKAVLAKVENSSAVVNKDYTEVGHHYMCTYVICKRVHVSVLPK